MRLDVIGNYVGIFCLGSGQAGVLVIHIFPDQGIALTKTAR